MFDARNFDFCLEIMATLENVTKKKKKKKKKKERANGFFFSLLNRFF